MPGPPTSLEEEDTRRNPGDKPPVSPPWKRSSPLQNHEDLVLGVVDVEGWGVPERGLVLQASGRISPVPRMGLNALERDAVVTVLSQPLADLHQTRLSWPCSLTPEAGTPPWGPAAGPADGLGLRALCLPRLGGVAPGGKGPVSSGARPDREGHCAHREPRPEPCPRSSRSYSGANSWLVNFRARQFSVIVRITCSGTSSRNVAWISSVTRTSAPGSPARCAITSLAI